MSRYNIFPICEHCDSEKIKMACDCKKGEIERNAILRIWEKFNRELLENQRDEYIEFRCLLEKHKWDLYES